MYNNEPSKQPDNFAEAHCIWSLIQRLLDYHPYGFKQIYFAVTYCYNCLQLVANAQKYAPSGSIKFVG